MSAINNGTKSAAKECHPICIAPQICNFVFQIPRVLRKNAEKLSLPAVSTPTFSPVVLLRLLDDPVLPQHRHIRLDRNGKPFVQQLDGLQQLLIGR